MTIDKDVFGRNLTALKAQSGQTWPEISHALGYKQPRYLLALAAGTHEPSLPTVRKVASYFGVTLASLLEDGAVRDEKRVSS